MLLEIHKSTTALVDSSSTNHRVQQGQYYDLGLSVDRTQLYINIVRSRLLTALKVDETKPLQRHTYTKKEAALFIQFAISIDAQEIIGNH